MFTSGRRSNLVLPWYPRKVEEEAPSTCLDPDLSSASNWEQNRKDQLCLWCMFLKAALCHKNTHKCFLGSPGLSSAWKRDGSWRRQDRSGGMRQKLCYPVLQRSAQELWTHRGFAHWEGLPVVLAVMLQLPEFVKRYESNHCTLFKGPFKNTDDSDNSQIFVTSPISLQEI